MTQPFKRIDADAALDLLTTSSNSAKSAVLFDIRDPESFASGHHPDAVHLTQDNLPSLVEHLDKTKPVMVCCYHGNSSQMVANYLAEQGFERACSIDGGWDGLSAAMEWRRGK